MCKIISCGSSFYNFSSVTTDYGKYGITELYILLVMSVFQFVNAAIALAYLTQQIRVNAENVRKKADRSPNADKKLDSVDKELLFWVGVFDVFGDMASIGSILCNVRLLATFRHHNLFNDYTSINGSSFSGYVSGIYVSLVFNAIYLLFRRVIVTLLHVYSNLGSNWFKCYFFTGIAVCFCGVIEFFMECAHECCFSCSCCDSDGCCSCLGICCTKECCFIVDSSAIGERAEEEVATFEYLLLFLNDALGVAVACECLRAAYDMTSLALKNPTIAQYSDYTATLQASFVMTAFIFNLVVNAADRFKQLGVVKNEEMTLCARLCRVILCFVPIIINCAMSTLLIQNNFASLLPDQFSLFNFEAYLICSWAAFGIHFINFITICARSSYSTNFKSSSDAFCDCFASAIAVPFLLLYMLLTCGNCFWCIWFECLDNCNPCSSNYNNLMNRCCDSICECECCNDCCEFICGGCNSICAGDGCCDGCFKKCGKISIHFFILIYYIF